MLEKGIDTVVLGCTHYPFVIPLIEEITGPDVRVIDPAPAVARQTRHVLQANALVSEDSLPVVPRFYTSGSPQSFSALIQQLLGETHPVHQATWQSDGSVLSMD